MAVICKLCMNELMRFEPAGDVDSQERVKSVIAPIVQAVEAHSKKKHNGNGLELYISRVCDNNPMIPDVAVAAFLDDDGDSDYGTM